MSAHNCSALSSLLYHVEWRRGGPRLNSLWGQARNLMDQICSLTGMSIKRGGDSEHGHLHVCTCTLFSDFYYPDQGQMSRAKGVHEEWEGTDQGTRESPECEVQLFGGTVCSGETIFLQ